MNILLCICILFFIFLQGCHQQSSHVNEDQFKNYANTNSVANSNTSVSPSPIAHSSTSEAQPDHQQPVTLVNLAF